MKIIVAIGKDGAIGKNHNLIWHIPEDLKRFKALTTGHPVIMGRKTWESLPKKPLLNRRNIVLTREKDMEFPGAETVNSIEEAIRISEGQQPFIIGGAEIYKAFLPYAEELYLTLVEDTCPEADAFLNIDFSDGWELIEEKSPEVTDGGIGYRYVNYRRILHASGNHK